MFSLIVSIGVIPALSASSVAEEREIPESLKHLFACDKTISLDKIVHKNNQVDESKNIVISGKVNIEEGSRMAREYLSK